MQVSGVGAPADLDPSISSPLQFSNEKKAQKMHYSIKHPSWREC